MLANISVADTPAAVTRFYEALRHKDVTRLRQLLAPNFVAWASAGMPLGAGGVHESAMAAVADLWAVVHQSYDVAPIPARIWPSADGEVIVHGWYEGTVRRDGASVRAEFVHLLRVEGDVLVELRQITDTGSWGAP